MRRPAAGIAAWGAALALFLAVPVPTASAAKDKDRKRAEKAEDERIAALLKAFDREYADLPEEAVDTTGGVPVVDPDAVARHHRKTLAMLHGASHPDVLARLKNLLGTEKNYSSYGDVYLAIATLDLPEAAAFLIERFRSTGEPGDHFSAKAALARCVHPDGLEWIAGQGVSKEGGLVRLGAIDLAGRLALAGATEPLLKIAEKGKDVAEVAFALAALGEIGDARALPFLRERARHKDDRIARAALIALGRLKDAESIPFILERLRSRDFEVHYAAIRALRHAGDVKAGLVLAELLSASRGRQREDILLALRAIAGKDLGFDTRDWIRHFRKAVREAEGGAPEEGLGEAFTPALDRGLPVFYGVKVFSERVTFVLDTSGSMDRYYGELTKPAKEADRKKLDVLKAEVFSALDGLAVHESKRGYEKSRFPYPLFRLVRFHTAVLPWKDDLLPASPENAHEARKYVQRLEPDGATNLWGAFDRALNVSGSLALPDTVILVSDGEPTSGETVSLSAIVEAVAHWNKMLGVRIHVIGIDSGNNEFMKEIAERNDGTYKGL